MPLSSYLKVMCKTASLEDINKAQRHMPYLGRYIQFHQIKIQTKLTMKKILTLALILCVCYVSSSQTLYVPSGTAGISTSPNGNVGIGHSNPDMKLDVRTSDVYVSRFHYNSTSTLSGIRIGRASSYGDLVTSTNGFGIGTGTSGSGLPLNSQNVSDLNFFISNSSGYVGFGTTSPNAKITLEGDGSTLGSASINLKHSGNGMSIGLSTNNNLVVGNSWNPESGTYLTILDGSGNVGIGTTSPTFKLHTNSTGTNNVALFESTDAYALLHLKDNTSTDSELIRRLGDKTGFYSGAVEHIKLDGTGNVGIGTATPESKLAVNGQIRATEVKVLTDVNSVPDFVFEPEYELRTLQETKEYITKNKHLPEIPSAAEIGENGIDLGDMNMRLLMKIEELTLYQIELLERLEKAEGKITKLESK